MVQVDIFLGSVFLCCTKLESMYKCHCKRFLIPYIDRFDLYSFATSISNVLAACDSEDVRESVETKNVEGEF